MLAADPYVANGYVSFVKMILGGIQYTQSLLNLYCNSATSFKDGTCCDNHEESLSSAQIVALFAYCCWLFSYEVVGKSYSSILLCFVHHSNPVTLSIGKLSAVMLFFYCCDRADFFMKENKWFTYFNLFLPIVYLSVLGLFFMDDTNNVLFFAVEPLFPD